MSNNQFSVTPFFSHITQLYTNSNSKINIPDPVIKAAIKITPRQAFLENSTQAATTVSAKAAYPHLFDPAQNSGQAMQFISRALEDSRDCLTSFGDGDLDEVQTKLGLIATQLSAAYPLIAFNRDFANVVAFLRRATLSVSAFEVDREMLNSLISAIRALINSPMISLMDAARLTQSLERHRWPGSHKAVEALLRSLMEQYDSEPQNLSEESTFRTAEFYEDRP